MISQIGPWPREEDLPLDEPADLPLTMSEMRRWVNSERHEEELGLRSILEHPEALSKAWWYHRARRRPRRRFEARSHVAGLDAVEVPRPRGRLDATTRRPRAVLPSS